MFTLIDSRCIFYRQVCNRVFHSVHVPGTCIVKEGDPGSSIFIVYKGTISGTVTGDNGEPNLTNVYKTGDCFGKFPALFVEESYKKSYRAESVVEILELRRRDVLHLCKKFPSFRRNLLLLITCRYDIGAQSKHIFHDWSTFIHEEEEDDDEELLDTEQDVRRMERQRELRRKKKYKLDLIYDKEKELDQKEVERVEKEQAEAELHANIETGTAETSSTYKYVMNRRASDLLRAAKVLAETEGLNSLGDEL